MITHEKEKFKTINIFNGKIIKEIKLLSNGIEIISTDGDSLVLNIELKQSYEIFPWLKKSSPKINSFLRN